MTFMVEIRKEGMKKWKNAVARWLRLGLLSERSEVRNLPPPRGVLEQDTLLTESISNTQEVVAVFRHDVKSVDWDVLPQHKQTKTN